MTSDAMNLDAMSLDERMKDVFADVFEVDASEISDQMTIANTADWDSLRSISLSFSLEQAFDIEFTDEELLLIDSYSTIRHLLVNKGLS